MTVSDTVGQSTEPDWEQRWFSISLALPAKISFPILMLFLFWTKPRRSHDQDPTSRGRRGDVDVTFKNSPGRLKEGCCLCLKGGC